MHPGLGGQVNPLKAVGVRKANKVRGLSRTLEKVEDQEKKYRLHSTCYIGTCKQQKLSILSRVPASGAKGYL